MMRGWELMGLSDRNTDSCDESDNKMNDDQENQ